MFEGMDPTLAFFLTTLLSIGTGIVTNRADAKAVAALDRIDKLKNHDLHRALWCSFYEAQAELCEDCKAKNRDLTDAQVRWLEERQYQLEQAKAELDGRSDLPVQDFGDVSLLLAPLESQPEKAFAATPGRGRRITPCCSSTGSCCAR